MKTTSVTGLVPAAGLLLGVPASGRAQVWVSIGIAFPSLPPLMLLQSGVQVVPEMNEEMFFVSRYYWVCRGGVWYRTADWHGGWRPVRRGWVFPALVRIPTRAVPLLLPQRRRPLQVAPGLRVSHLA